MPDQSPIPSNVGEVRPNHRFDEARLAAWLKANVEGVAGPVEVRQFHGGASNPTFLVTAGPGTSSEQRLVLRKKPPGQLLASAHQVDREYRVMKALGTVGFPVPNMRALCLDDGVIGTTF
jgi:aminoglycoside phosphotransferase (APT) family kinase protein